MNSIRDMKNEKDNVVALTKCPKSAKWPNFIYFRMGKYNFYNF